MREVAAPDVGRMGIEILSFTIKDVYDNVEYLSSLGRSQTAAVKRDADVGVAQSNRDAGIKEAECQKSAMDIKFETDTKIENDTRAYKLQVANFEKEINTGEVFFKKVEVSFHSVQIFQSLRFYVKSILGILEVLKLLFFTFFSGCEFGPFGKYQALKSAKIHENQKSEPW